MYKISSYPLYFIEHINMIKFMGKDEEIMIILHEATRVDGQGQVKGFITKMNGVYYIIPYDNENVAYPVSEKSIKPYIEGATLPVPLVYPKDYDSIG